MIKKVRKKPIVVEARQAVEGGIIITAHGPVPYNVGDWILTDPNTGDTWPIRAEIFDKTYEEVGDD